MSNANPGISAHRRMAPGFVALSPGYNAICRTIAIGSTLPMSGHEAPARAGLEPVGRHPVPAATLAHPVTVDPDVAMAVPAPVAGDPDIAPARRRDDDDPRRGRCGVDLDGDGRSLADACSERSRAGDQNAKSDSTQRHVLSPPKRVGPSYPVSERRRLAKNDFRSTRLTCLARC